MNAHFANQIRRKTIGNPNAVAFRGPARQYGSGGLGEFAMRMCRVAMPLVKQYVMPLAKDFGTISLSAFVPEISKVISSKTRPNAVLVERLKKSASKTIASNTSAAAASSIKVNARAYTSKKPIVSVWDCSTDCHAAEGGAGRSGRASHGAGRHRVESGPSSGRRTRGNKKKGVICRKKCAARSRSDILSRVAFNNKWKTCLASMT